MYPTLFELQGLSFNTWGLMVMVAFGAACLLVGRRAGAVGIDPDKLVGFYFALIAASIPGARLFHFLLAEREAFLAQPGLFFDPGAGGMAFLGGVIGGVLGGAAYALAARIPAWKLADVAAPAIMLGYAIGRVGCFFAGCCHGAACGAQVERILLDLPGGNVVWVEGFPYLALTWERGVGVGRIFSVPVYPTQLWEIAIGLALFGLLTWMWRSWRWFDGQIMAALLVTYPLARIVTERFRGDTIRGLYEVGGAQLSSSQLAGGFLLLVALGITLLRWPYGVAPEAPFEPEED